MKTYIIFSILIISSYLAKSQSYEPTTTWPYLFSDFQDGNLFSTKGDVLVRKLNIHLLNSTIHYLENDKIIEVNNSDIYKVQIDNKIFVNVNNDFCLIECKKGDYLMVVLNKADLSALDTETGAYGIGATTAATNKMSNLQVAGISNLNYSQMLLDKDDGKVLPVSKFIYFVNNGKSILAKKNELQKKMNANLFDEFNSFLKSNKIKWSSKDDLETVLQYLNEKNIIF